MEPLIKYIASLWLTLTLLVLLGVAVGWSLWHPEQTTLVLTGPFVLLSLNLLAAILAHPSFRTQLPLLIFHLSLLLLLILIALGRLTYLKGWDEISEGAEFDGTLTGYSAGPWHPWHLDRLRFTNEAMEVNYDPGPRRGYTFNRVSWLDSTGERQVAEIGDQLPLKLQGYRFYTSKNHGFAPVFRWQPREGGAPLYGDLHLPSYPLSGLRQTAEWTPPGTASPLWFLLSFNEKILAADVASTLHPPVQHTLVVREGEGDGRWELQPGDEIELTAGRLHYLGLRNWMGYSVYYDWTMPWLSAAALAALLSMGWHLWLRFNARPWLQESPRGGLPPSSSPAHTGRGSELDE